MHCPKIALLVLATRGHGALAGNVLSRFAGDYEGTTNRRVITQELSGESTVIFRVPPKDGSFGANAISPS